MTPAPVLVSTETLNIAAKPTVAVSMRLCISGHNAVYNFRIYGIAVQKQTAMNQRYVVRFDVALSIGEANIVL